MIIKGSKITTLELNENLKEAVKRIKDYDELVTTVEEKENCIVKSFSSNDKAYEVFLKPFIACSCE